MKNNRCMIWGGRVLLLLSLFVMGGCALFRGEMPVREGSLARVEPGEAGYPNFVDDMDFKGLETALTRSLDYYQRIPESRTFLLGGDRYGVATMARSVAALRSAIQDNPSPEALSLFIRRHYRVYRATGRTEVGDVLFTGYFEAALSGHGERTDRYRYPVLTRPDDLVTIDISQFPGVTVTGKRHIIGRVTETGRVVPYYAREEVGDGLSLVNRAQPLAWVDDAVDLFFLEIQGSGIITMADGQEMRVHYQTKNGHPYRSIGGYLIAKGALTKEEVSMQSIRRWLEAHPRERRSVFNYNPSMVFFQEEPTGPLGCYSVPVTPYRSIATDKRLFPACGIAFITTEKPVNTNGGEVTQWAPFGRFVLNQDTGGAIKGSGRVDLFTGHGAEAEMIAGHMKQPGALYFLVLNPSSDAAFQAHDPGA